MKRTPPPYRSAVAEFEQRYLIEVLRAGKGNVSAAARIAGVARQSLYDMAKRHGFTFAHPKCRAPLSKRLQRNGIPGIPA